MIKAELFDLGPHNGMGEPDPTGSYWAFTVRDLGQPGDEAQALTFLVPAHQLPTDHAQAEKEAAVAAAREACASRLESLKDTAYQNNFLAEGVTYSCAIDAIRYRSDTDALAERDARVRAEALREAADMARRMSLNFAEQAYDAPNPERDFGKVDGAIKVEEVILALVSTDQEGDG